MKRLLFRRRFILLKKGFTLHLFRKQKRWNCLSSLLKKGEPADLPFTFLKKKGEGFTLTEMTIVIAIFILIVTAVYSAFILNQRAYLSGERMAEITQNGRVILERITREIRQAREIITEIPAERVNPPNEIIFQDGHIPLISEEGVVQSAGLLDIVFSSFASDKDDYYKDVFLEITGGAGTGQTKKIVGYQGATRTADIEGAWDTVPDSSSSYKIDSSYYYIRYYLDTSNNAQNIQREIITYCISEDSLTCLEPKLYVPWDIIPQGGQTLLRVVLEEPRIIGEYISSLEFWGSRVINIALTLEKGEGAINLETKIFGRNL